MKVRASGFRLDFFSRAGPVGHATYRNLSLVAGACSVGHRQAVHVSPWAPAGVPPLQDLRHLEEALPTLASACRTLGSGYSADMLLQLT